MFMQTDNGNRFSTTNSRADIGARENGKNIFPRPNNGKNIFPRGKIFFLR